MKINGMEAKYLGTVGFEKDNPMNEVLYGTPDGKRYVELYMHGNDIVEYNWMKHGFIWFDDAVKSDWHCKGCEAPTPMSCCYCDDID